MALADPEVLVQKFIQNAMPSITVGTLIPMDMPDPFVLVRAVPGQEALRPGLAGRALVDVQVWAGGLNAKTAARNRLQSISDVLYTAWRQQTVLPTVGYIAGRFSATDPVLLMDGTEPHRTYRYQARFSFSTRPL